MRILIAEDDAVLADGLSRSLKAGGYAVDVVASGDAADTALAAQAFDLLILDLGLPQLAGLEVLRRLRRTSQLPVIMLTARDAVMDKVTGLDMGADDYITKPFSIEELLARIRTALRKQVKQESAQLTYGPLSLDVLRHLVTVESDTVELTGREFSLLQSLLENQGIVMTRETLMDRVWGYDFVGETNLVDVYIRYLRAKIAEKTDKKLIQTVRGVGYVLREEEGA